MDGVALAGKVRHERMEVPIPRKTATSDAVGEWREHLTAKGKNATASSSTILQNMMGSEKFPDARPEAGVDGYLGDAVPEDQRVLIHSQMLPHTCRAGLPYSPRVWA